VKDQGEPREASRFLRRNNRAFGSLPYSKLNHYDEPETFVTGETPEGPISYLQVSRLVAIR
jgi:hypothetical protein